MRNLFHLVTTGRIVRLKCDDSTFSENWNKQTNKSHQVLFTVVEFESINVYCCKNCCHFFFFNLTGKCAIMMGYRCSSPCICRDKQRVQYELSKTFHRILIGLLSVSLFTLYSHTPVLVSWLGCCLSVSWNYSHTPVLVSWLGCCLSVSSRSTPTLPSLYRDWVAIRQSLHALFPHSRPCIVIGLLSVSLFTLYSHTPVLVSWLGCYPSVSSRSTPTLPSLYRDWVAIWQSLETTPTLPSLYRDWVAVRQSLHALLPHSRPCIVIGLLSASLFTLYSHTPVLVSWLGCYPSVSSRSTPTLPSLYRDWVAIRQSLHALLPHSRPCIVIGLLSVSLFTLYSHTPVLVSWLGCYLSVSWNYSHTPVLVSWLGCCPSVSSRSTPTLPSLYRDWVAICQSLHALLPHSRPCIVIGLLSVSLLKLLPHSRPCIVIGLLSVSLFTLYSHTPVLVSWLGCYLSVSSRSTPTLPSLYRDWVAVCQSLETTPTLPSLYRDWVAVRQSLHALLPHSRPCIVIGLLSVSLFTLYSHTPVLVSWLGCYLSVSSRSTPTLPSLYRDWVAVRQSLHALLPHSRPCIVIGLLSVSLLKLLPHSRPCIVIGLLSVSLFTLYSHTPVLVSWLGCYPSVSSRSTLTLPSLYRDWVAIWQSLHALLPHSRPCIVIGLLSVCLFTLYSHTPVLVSWLGCYLAVSSRSTPTLPSLYRDWVAIWQSLHALLSHSRPCIVIGLLSVSLFTLYSHTPVLVSWLGCCPSVSSRSTPTLPSLYRDWVAIRQSLETTPTLPSLYRDWVAICQSLHALLPHSRPCIVIGLLSVCLFTLYSHTPVLVSWLGCYLSVSSRSTPTLPSLYRDWVAVRQSLHALLPHSRPCIVIGLLSVSLLKLLPHSRPCIVIGLLSVSLFTLYSHTPVLVSWLGCCPSVSSRSTPTLPSLYRDWVAIRQSLETTPTLPSLYRDWVAICQSLHALLPHSRPCIVIGLLSVSLFTLYSHTPVLVSWLGCYPSVSWNYSHTPVLVSWLGCYLSVSSRSTPTLPSLYRDWVAIRLSLHALLSHSRPCIVIGLLSVSLFTLYSHTPVLVSWLGCCPSVSSRSTPTLPSLYRDWVAIRQSLETTPTLPSLYRDWVAICQSLHALLPHSRPCIVIGLLSVSLFTLYSHTPVLVSWLGCYPSVSWNYSHTPVLVSWLGCCLSVSSRSTPTLPSLYRDWVAVRQSLHALLPHSRPCIVIGLLSVSLFTLYSHTPVLVSWLGCYPSVSWNYSHTLPSLHALLPHSRPCIVIGLLSVSLFTLYSHTPVLVSWLGCYPSVSWNYSHIPVLILPSERYVAPW